MITGFTGMGLNELVGVLSRSKHGQPPSRSVQPMPGMDTVHFSARGRQMSASGEQASLAVQRPVAVDRPAAPDKPVQPAGEMSMLDRMRASFFTSAGDDGFDPTADLNSDGRINLDDLAVLRHKQDASDPKQMLQQMKDSFFTRDGDDRFDASVDLNTDGIINFADLALLRARMETTVTRPPPSPTPIPLPDPIGPVDVTVAAPVIEPNPASGKPRFDVQPDTTSTLDAIRSSFFRTAGEETFNAAADLDGDGRVNFADLAVLRSRLEG